MLCKLLRSQNGFSIVQGMILAAMVAGLAFVGTRLTTDQKNLQKGVEAKSKIEQLHDMVYSILQNRDHCATTLVLNGVSGTLSTTSPQPLTGIVTTGTASLAAAPFRVNTSGSYDPNLMYMSNSVSIDAMTITYPSNFQNNAQLRVTYGSLDSSTTKRSGRGYGVKAITKTINIKVQRDIGTGAFKSCYAIETAENENMIEDFCEDLGADGDDATPSLFVWNPDFQTCTIRDLKCNPGEIYAGFDSNGNKRCNRIENWMDMNRLLDSSTSPVNCAGQQIRFTVSGQRVKITCGP